MREFVITTDNNADLPDNYYIENEVGCVSLTYTVDDITYNKDNSLPVREFYDKMRNGSMPTTAQVNPDNARELMEPYVRAGKDVLHIAFSSGLSGSYNSSRIAAEELKEEYKDATIVVIDSLCASLGQGLLVYKAVELKKAGKSMEEIVSWIEEHIAHLCHVFTVSDLNHLHRGGRVSKMTAIVGTMINIKPILHVDKDGKLIPIGKVRGRKKSLQELVNLMGENIGEYVDENDIIFISHGDCEEDAIYVQNLVKERFGYENFLINPVGPTIGAHSGPGTIALFYLGKER